IIVTGREAPVMSAHGDNEEMRKAITSLALAGDRMVVLDNVAGGLGCAALDAALTTTTWKDRVLGASRIVELPLYVTWAAPGKNGVLLSAAARRGYHVGLESPEEPPEDRTGFAHADLRAYVREHRAELLGAALTVLRGYFAAGCPDQKLTPWGSFEGWSA